MGGGGGGGGAASEANFSTISSASRPDPDLESKRKAYVSVCCVIEGQVQHFFYIDVYAEIVKIEVDLMIIRNTILKPDRQMY